MNNKFNTTLDSIANIVSFNDPDKITGYSSEEIIGKNWFTVFIPFQNTIEIMKVFQDTFNDSTVHWEYKNNIRHKDGSEIRISFKNTKLFNENNIQEFIYSEGYID